MNNFRGLRFEFIFAFLLVALLFVISNCNVAKSYPPAPQNYLKYRLVHLQYYDKTSGNFFFRGNMPKNTSNEFAYTELMTFLAERALEEGGVELPSNAFLYDISLDSLYNENDTLLEQNFFLANPQLGNFSNWSLYHRYPDPSNFTQQQIKQMVQNMSLWGPDDFPPRMTLFHQMMKTKQERAVAYYIHCETGCDRTGEFCGSYMMQYLNDSLATALTIDTADCGRPPYASSQWQLQWYCYYLVDVLNYTSLTTCNITSPVEDWNLINIY